MLPVSFIQNNNLLSSFGKCDFLLSEHFDFVSNNINTSVNTRHIVIRIAKNIIACCDGTTHFRVKHHAKIRQVGTCIRKKMMYGSGVNTNRSLEALSSKTASLYVGPSRVLAKHKILVVLPVPGGPLRTKQIFSHNKC